MVTVKPQRLKKERDYCVYFRSDLPCAEPGSELACFAAKRNNLIGTAVFACLIPIVAYLGILAHDPVFVFYIILVSFALLHTLHEGTKKIHIHQFGIIIKSAIYKKFYPYNELEALQSYNVLNAFHKGISYGYRLIKNGQVLLSMDVRQYPNINSIETVFNEYNDVLEKRDLEDVFPN